MFDPFAYGRAALAAARPKLSVADVRALGGYSIVYADPPWQYNNSGCIGAAEKQYSTMSFNQLCSMPVSMLAANDCALFMWATYPKIHDALNLIPYWGFQYKGVAFDWVKMRAGKPVMGLGWWARGSSEICLLATRGKPRRQDAKVMQYVETLIDDDDRILYYPRGRHSAKPPEVRDRIVRLMGNMPRVELFARERVPGWDAWGIEVDSDLVLT